MKNWRKWVALVLVIALPVTGFAGLSFAPHYDSHTQEINPSFDWSSTDHCADNSESSHKANKSSQSKGCHCECNSHIACISASAVAFAISEIAKVFFVNSNGRLIHYVPSQIFSLNLFTIFRPPIFVS